VKVVTKQEILDGFGGKYTWPEAHEIFLRLKEGDISDGYHTFSELYDHRCLLYICLCLATPTKAKWKSDENYGDWICLYLELPTGQISYHVPAKFLPLFQNKIEKSETYLWDGHSSPDVLTRLMSYSTTFKASGE
jgi:hypothetical protein